MKKFFNYLLPVAAVALLAIGCEKALELNNYGNGKAVTLSSSTATVAPTATDSLNTVLRFNWTSPEYAIDSSTYKYVLQVDSANRNFSKAVSRTIIGTRNLSFIGKDWNKILLDFGFAFNQPYDVDVRVISSYSNNNEPYTSNTVKLRVTPYKIPPRVALPTGLKLWANGGGLTWNWTGAPPTPQSEFSRIDETTWAAVLNMNAGSEFLVLSQNGGTDPYDRKYAVPNSSAPGITAGGTFGFYPPGTGGDNFKTPSPTGWYIMKFDFQLGNFTINSFGPNALPQDLYITGNATPSNWTNTPPAAQKFTRLNSCEYTIDMAFTPGNFYKFLSVSGQWQPQFGNNLAAGGALNANYGGGGDPDAIPTPAMAGNYRINVNFATGTYTVTKLP
jgi:starch-binding outer membrane protein SusE/F